MRSQPSTQASNREEQLAGHAAGLRDPSHGPLCVVLRRLSDRLIGFYVFVIQGTAWN